MRLVNDDRGQAVVITALLMTMLLGMMGIGIDIGWFQLTLIRMQRAADAAALAGVVYLPGNQTGAFNAAYAEATKNGFANGVGGVTVVPRQDSGNNRMLEVTIQSPIPTYFARLFGTSSVRGSRMARAEFVLPVPMGSPQDYFGIANLCRNSDALGSCPSVPSASSGTLSGQGFWATILTNGANRGNGDAYSPYYNPKPSLNAGYDPNGYPYIVEFQPGTIGGEVWIFDPMFCATGRKTTTPFQRLGLGDAWYSIAASRNVTTEYKLWDMHGTPFATSDDTLIASDGGLFTNMDFADKGLDYRGNSDYGPGYNGASSADCSTNPYHNAWWRLASGLGEGQYRLQVVTSAGGITQNALNNFGIQLTTTAGSGARIYGKSRMAANINVASSTALFYLCQIDAVHAGKTLEIRLFDPGDISNTTLRIKQPTATGYTDATFRFTATGSSGGAPTSGGPQTSLVTSNLTTGFYENQWVTIQVSLPSSYTAPTPPGETQPGWWKIEYTVGATGQDVTTWEVSIRGNPVHLVVP